MKQAATVPAYLPFSIGFLWLWSGIQPVSTALPASLDLLAAVGVPEFWRYPALLAASAWDVALGVLCFSRCRYRSVFWLLQLVTVAVYSVVIAVGLPDNWLHPFAPLVKNIPIMALMYFMWRNGAAAPCAEERKSI